MNAFNFEAQHQMEERVLGMAISNFTGAVSSSLATLDVSCFTKQSTMAVFRMIQKLQSAGRPVEMITVQALANRDEYLPEEVTPEWLRSITSNSSGGGNISAWCDVLRSNRAMRNARSSLLSVVACIEQEQDPVEAMKKVRAALLAVDTGEKRSKPVKIGELANKYLEERKDIYDGKIEPGLELKTAGMRDAFGVIGRSDLVVIAGRPGSGKTETAISLCNDLCLKSGKAVLYKSLEMSGVEVAERAILSIANLSVDDVTNHGIFEDINAISSFQEAMQSIQQAEFYIEDSTGDDIHRICRDARDWASQTVNAGAIVIDYVGLIEVGSGHSRHDLAIAEITRALKNLAKELGIPVFGLFQLSRDVEKRIDKRPVSSDLRDSGSIEQDADKIVMVYRDCVYDSASPMGNVIELINTKRRRGQPKNGYMRFENGHLVPMSQNEQISFHRIAIGADEDSSNRNKKKSFF